MFNETSWKVMTEDEKPIWESLISDSTQLILLLKDYDLENKFLGKYINILFGFRCTEEDYDKLSSFVQMLNQGSRTGYDLDMFNLQKLLKSYLGDIDSTLDYLDKFYKELMKDTGSKSHYFNRKGEYFAKGLLRNIVLHEGVPTISFDSFKRFTCHVNTAGYERVHSIINLTFNINEKESKRYDLGNFLTLTFDPTRELIQRKTNELIRILG